VVDGVEAHLEMDVGCEIMNEIRLSKEMKFMLLHLMAYGDTPMRFVGQIYNEFCDNPTELPNSKLLKDTIRLLKHCDYYWGGSYVEEFTAEMKKLLPDLEVTV
tara:strand:+ start:740 stop:1048 length:309 start_codon:yes stop_codon:yes gene_type:complete